jgi:outer membrane lipoprotein-sorting protein
MSLRFSVFKQLILTMSFSLAVFANDNAGQQLDSRVSGDAQKKAVELPSLRAIFEGYYRENGGRLAHDNLRSYRMVGKLERDGNSFPLWIFRKHPNRFRIVQSTADGRIVFGFDGSTFWRGLQREGRMVTVERVDDYNRLELAFEADFRSPLISLQRLASGLEVVGADVIDGRKAFIVQGLMQDAATIRVWVDSENFQELYLEFISDEKRFRVEFSDYRKVGAFWFAHSILSVSNEGNSYSQITVSEITLNPGLFDSFFTPDFISQ